MKFTLNSVKADLDLMKAVVTAGRIEKIEEEVKKIKTIEFDLETVKYQMEYTVNRDQLEDLKLAMQDLVPTKHYEGLLLDFQDLQKNQVNLSDFDSLQEDFKRHKSQFGNFAEKAEIVKRLTVINDEFLRHLSNHPTIAQMKKMYKTIDDKIVSQRNYVELSDKKLQD